MKTASREAAPTFQACDWEGLPQRQLCSRRECFWESSCGLCRVGDRALSFYVSRRHPLWDGLSAVGISVGHGLPRGLGRRRQVTHPVLCVPWWESREICPRGAGDPSGLSDGPPVSLTLNVPDSPLGTI